VYAIEYQFWDAGGSPAVEVIPAPTIQVSPVSPTVGDPLFGLDETGIPATYVAMWVVGTAITLGVIVLGVVLAIHAGRGVERVATKYIERKR